MHRLGLRWEESVSPGILVGGCRSKYVHWTDALCRAVGPAADGERGSGRKSEASLKVA